MASRQWLGLGALVVALAAGAGEAQAQYQPPSSPVISPYLNLFRGGGSLTSNYFTLVRPQLDFQASLNQVQQQIQYGLQNTTVQAIDPGVTTGQVAGFMTHQAYFGGIVPRNFGVVNAALPGAATSGQRAFAAPGLNTPAFYNSSLQGATGQPLTTPTTRPPGQ
jgi:hypothetical protein